MPRLLSGLQPSGQLHLGNYVGAIKQFLELQDTHESYVFVASYHALTTVRDPEVLRANIRQVVIDYLAFGLDPKKTHIYLQQDVPAVTELAWILGCLCPKSQMDKATGYKDKVAKGITPNIGLYTYPILQAADILAVDPDVVPVGEDQRQNVEIARTLAQKFNHAYGTEDEPVFKVPEVLIRPETAVLPGLDGQKMSKSYGNTIDPFLPEKKLRKTIMKIVSDSTPVEDAKDPENDTTFQLFSALAGAADPRTVELAEKYRSAGIGFGYGHAKQALFELVLETFAEPRKRREELMGDAGYVEAVLKEGAEAAGEELTAAVQRVRFASGLR